MTAVGQVVGELRSAIVDGTRAPGERLPSEPDLARTLGISRPTLRDALRALEDEGLVRRVHVRPQHQQPGPARLGHDRSLAGCALDCPVDVAQDRQRST